MTWIEPKTDWISTDYFNPKDYNRIIGNLAHLKAFSEELFLAYDILSMGSQKGYESSIYAREINAIETNLEIINNNTYDLEIGEKQTYKANGKTPFYSEFNRIESAMLRLYNEMQIHKANLSRLTFTLGNQKGIRV